MNPELRSSARLTWEQVRAIRAAYSHGQSIRALARVYHLDPHTVFDIVHNLHWRETSAPDHNSVKEKPQ